MITLETHRRGDGRLLLRLKGRFDRDSALALSRRLAAARPRGLVIDFATADAIDDASMPILADLLRDYSEQVTLTGLRDHHLRLLAYFGVWSREHAAPQ